MKAYPISKSFTAVVVLLVALSSWGAGKAKNERAQQRDQCKKECPLTDYTDECKDDEKSVAKCKQNAQKACLDLCMSDMRDERNSCKTLLTEFEKMNAEIKDQCGQIEQSNTEDCRKSADECGKLLNTTGLDAEENEDATEKMFKAIYGIAGMGDETKEVESDNQCTYEENEKEQDRSETKITKISKLREEMASLKEDIAKAEDEVAKEKQKVDEKILELEKEMDKRTVERKTESQKETLKMQQEVLEALKRMKSTLKTIEDKNRIIASLRITQQEEAIKFSTSNLMKACRDDALKLKAALIEAATKAAATSNQGTAVTGNIKKDVEIFAKQCIKLANVERTKALKSTQDKISFENSNIKDLQESVKLDDQAAVNRQKDLEARTKITEEEQTKAEEKKTKELGQLSQKISDIQALTDKKKITIAEKMAAKEDEMKPLLLKLNNKIPKFKSISSSIKKSTQKVGTFVEQCCGEDTKFSINCQQLKADYPAEAASVKEIKKTKAKK